MELIGDAKLNRVPKAEDLFALHLGRVSRCAPLCTGEKSGKARCHLPSRRAMLLSKLGEDELQLVAGQLAPVDLLAFSLAARP